MAAAKDFSGAHRLQQRAHDLSEFFSFDQVSHNRKTPVEGQAGDEQRLQFLGKLQQLSLANAPAGKQRHAKFSRLGGAVPRQRDFQRHASHLMKTRHHALLHFGFHDTFDDLARLVSRAILKESHLLTL